MAIGNLRVVLRHSRLDRHVHQTRQTAIGISISIADQLIGKLSNGNIAKYIGS